MASFHSKTLSKCDEWYTPASAWEDLYEIIDFQQMLSGKKIWEAFPGDGRSADNLRKMGWDVISDIPDFFEGQPDPKEWDLTISNPPFSKKKEVFTRLKKLGKPFIMICPASMLTTKYIRELFDLGPDEDPDDNTGLKIIIPRKRIQFLKPDEDGKTTKPGRCNFDCFYYCWQLQFHANIDESTMRLPDLSWVDPQWHVKNHKRDYL